MISDRDSLYANPLGEVTDFCFDEKVARVFPDMIQRSVPGYGAIIAAIGLLGKRYAQTDSYCYDLGCSLGAAALSLSQLVEQPGCRIIAVDNSLAMLNRCQMLLAKESCRVPVELICADVRAIRIIQASVVVLNFTLQFIPPQDRAQFLGGIFSGLLPGGILILSEKLAFSDPLQQQLYTDMHHAFKRAKGYSELEISQKRSALENVLIPESLEQHRARLLGVGFTRVAVWFQYFNFASLIAIK